MTKPLRRSVGQRVRYRFDNTISRGTLPVIGYLALVTAAFIFVAAVVVAITGIAINDDRHPGFGETLWQSLLRILDPGTFSGDHGWPLRILMFVVTLFGISIAAVLIGLIASGIEQRIEQLRRGRSAVVETDHTLILGFSPRVFTIIAELCIANENRRHPAIVVLASHDKEEMEDEIASRVDNLRNTRVVCRTGDPASLHDLGMANVAAARSIVVLGTEGADGDAGVVKAVLAALHAVGDPSVPIVAELEDAEAGRALREASGDRVHPVRTADIIARITAQACRQSGLSVVCQDLLDFDGDEIYFHPAPELIGRTFGDALLAYEESSIIGLRRSDGTIEVNPPVQTQFGDGDSVVAISEDDDTVVFTGLRDSAGVVAPAPRHEPRSEHLIVVGWNTLGPVILEELDQFVPPGSSAEIFVDPDLVDPAELVEPGLERLRVHFEVERGDLDELTASVRGRAVDHVIILGYRSGISPADADARTLLTLLLLRRALDGDGQRAHPARIVTELLDSGDVELAQATGADDFVVSDALSSLMIAQLSENPRLDPVFADLFDAEGSAVGLKPASLYATDGPVPFETVVAAARARGEAAIGYRLADGGGGAPRVVMNPAKSSSVSLGAQDQVVVVGPPG